MIKQFNHLPCDECRLKDICKHVGKLDALWQRIALASSGSEVNKITREDTLNVMVCMSCECQHMEREDASNGKPEE